MYACTTDAPKCACESVRVCSGAHASAPQRSSPFRRRRPRVARLAGVPVGVGVQREHRRVEHRACHRDERGMRRLFGPAARHRGGMCATNATLYSHKAIDVNHTV
jgi:hypothetical protein